MLKFLTVIGPARPVKVLLTRRGINRLPSTSIHLPVRSHIFLSQLHLFF
jgi:hypothetical protein